MPKTLGFWIPTALICLATLGGGIMDLSHNPDLVTIMAHLGYPTYLMTLLGAWKIAGVIAILAPGTPRLKEWAYAGLFFDLSGAVVSHLAAGDSFPVPPVVLLVLTGVSYFLRPESRRLAGPVV